jgi:hypothetical protein
MSFRQFNESEEDLDRERNAAGIVEKEWGIDIQKLSPFLYQVDWAFFKDKHLVGFAEYKWRSCVYDPFIISYAKWFRGMELAEVADVPFYFIVEWPNGIWYYRNKRSDAHTLPIKLGGNSRGQNGDLEPCIQISMNKFKQLRLKNENQQAVQNA